MLGFDARQGDASRGHRKANGGSKIPLRQSPSSSGPGRRPLTPTTRVRTPLGTPGFLKIARPPQRIRAIFLSLEKVKSVGRSVRKTISLHRHGETVRRPPNGFRRYIRTVSPGFSVEARKAGMPVSFERQLFDEFLPRRTGPSRRRRTGAESHGKVPWISKP